MRPQKLTVKNFMPFRVTDGLPHEVDFSALDLFAVTGPMASGKSSLIDAVIWCLYGKTARYGNDSKGVVSTGENLCEVAFDFTVGERWFRAVRRTGKTTESGLSEMEAGEWVQDVSGSDQLTKRVEALLGLDFDGFTKTVILPQGKYAEFLSSKPGDRRELLASVLELGVYARVSERAKQAAAQAKTRADTLRETLAQYAGVSPDLVEQRRQEHTGIEKSLAETGGRESVLHGLVQRTEQLTAVATRLAGLQAEEQQRINERDAAAGRLHDVEARLRQQEQGLQDIRAARDALAYDARHHEVVGQAAANLRDAAAARQEVERKRVEGVAVQQEVARLAQQIVGQGRETVTVRQTCETFTAAIEEAVTRHGDVAALTERLGEAKRYKELLREQEHLAEQQRRHTAQLTQVHQQLTQLRRQEAAKDEELGHLRQRREQQRVDEQEKTTLLVEAEGLGKELQEAVREEKRAAKEHEETQATYTTAEQEWQKQQAALVAAEQREQAAALAFEEARRRNAVQHLRTTLHVGEPCPVCQAPVGEVPGGGPAEQGDLTELQRALESARTALHAARQMQQRVHATLAAAGAGKTGAERELAMRRQKRVETQECFTARFPGHPSLSAALGVLQAQRQELVTTLRATEAKAEAVEKEQRALAQQREQAQREEAALTEALRNLAARLEDGKTQEADLRQSLAAALTAGEDPEAVLTVRRHALLRQQQELKSTEQHLRQAEELLAALRTGKAQKEGTLGILTSQRDAALNQEARATRTAREHLALAADAPLPDLPTLEAELALLAQKRQQHDTLSQREHTLREEQTAQERAVAECRADVQARGRLLQELRGKTAQAVQECEQLRGALRAEVEARGVTGIGDDGEGLREQLAAVREESVALRERRGRLAAEVAELERRCAEKEQEEEKLRTAEAETRVAADLHKLLGSEFTDFLSQGAVQALMRDATVHLQRLTHGRYSFDIAYKKKQIDLQIVDHEDHGRARPTHSLSGGETFLASLAIALALSRGFREVATGKAAKTSTECLILDEGFGTLDREGVQLVTETLQELRGEEGRMVGIITHVEEVAAAMPMRIEVRKGNRASTITVTG